MDAFLQAYKGLNNAQKEAVDTTEGPVMVVAGPGTGKTQILTLRIANILATTDTKPEQILALTFTEAAAYNMSRRLTELIGNAAYRVVLSTFHSFCNDIIKRYPEDFPRIIGSKSITEVDQVTIIEKIIEAGQWVLLKPFGDRFLYVRDIVKAIGELKREGITPEKMSALLHAEKNRFASIADLRHEKGPHAGKMKGEYQKLERKILKNDELAQIYAGYQAQLFAAKQYDFNDMILEVLGALEQNAALLQMLQEEHQYILVDEHQDTNNAQNKIIELIMNYHESPNLFVVGDEKQAIYRFQGASLENFQYFQKQYPSARLITLTENYRSTQNILTTAERLIPGREALKKNTTHTEHPIVVGAFTTSAVERYYLAHQIQEHIEQGIPAEEIAVLYRNNKDAFPLARTLDALRVSYTIESDQDLFTQRDVERLLVILRAIANYGNDVYVAPLLHLALFGIDPLDTYKVLRAASDRKKSIYEIISESTLLAETAVRDTEVLLALGATLKKWVRESREQNLSNFLEYIVRDSKLLEEMLTSGNVQDRLDAVHSLFEEAGKLSEINTEATVQDFFAYIETVKKHKLFLKRKNQRQKKGRVRLMTVHRAKGLEFAHVYIINAVDGIFGGKIDRERLPLLDSVYTADLSAKTSQEGSADADERRLFYVALTRAKETVTITYASEDDQHRELLPSEFIAEIRSELLENLSTALWEERYKNDHTIPFAAATQEASTYSLKDKAFVTDLFQRQGLSPTALNNYLECPWKYFYQNLIRVPSTQTIHQYYGIAVHAALQDLFKRMIQEETTKAFLLESFKGHLYRQPLSPRDLDDLVVKGEHALSGWYDTYTGTWNPRVTTEFRINGIELETETGERIKLTGVLDKVEYADDEIVDVIDYKTAKPKTRNDIMGKTKGADGNYYRQLVFYKLLLNNFAEGKYSMQSGTIDFVEPDEKGKYHKETFEITDDEVAALTETIMRVAQEITSLTFWDSRCGEKDCTFCGLRELIQ